jgi:hypothetical protein
VARTLRAALDIADTNGDDYSYRHSDGYSYRDSNCYSYRDRDRDDSAQPYPDCDRNEHGKLRPGRVAASSLDHPGSIWLSLYLQRHRRLRRRWL